jgi:hypothetical protein
VQIRLATPISIGYRVNCASKSSGLWCNSSISAREADGPGANPGFLTKKRKRATSAQGDWPIRKRICSKSNPSPGTKISRRYLDESCSSRSTFVSLSAQKGNAKLFTAIHRFSMGRSSQIIAPNEGVVAHRERAAGCKSGDAGSSPACENPASAAPLVHRIHPRSSTARERPDSFWRCGFDSIGSANLTGR